MSLKKKVNSDLEGDDLIQLKKVKSKVVAQAVMKILRLDKVNGVYSKTHRNEGVAFIDAVLDQLSVRYEVNERDLQHIPKEGPFVVIGNHPYGGIDGMILMSIMLKYRPDFKMMVNYMLRQFPEISGYTIEVDPFDRPQKSGMNLKGLKRSLNFLNEGIPVGIFPAGEVSAFNLQSIRVTDRIWHPVAGKLIAKANVKVVPVYFSGHNSLLFSLLGMINPKLRTARLPAELFNKNEIIKVRIGKPVSAETLKSFDSSEQMLRFLRAKTYSLGSSLDVKSFFIKREKRKEIVEPIIEASDSSVLNKEIEELKKRGSLLTTLKNFSVLLADARDIPVGMREISRLREITFREIGEGTNHSADTDEFDILYKHLILWDDEKQAIAGAYRIGVGPTLYERYRKKGFYLNELFKFNKAFNPIFKSALELGRSFVVKAYQRNPYSLMLLWKGIYEYVKQRNDIQYLIGPVSISNSYTKLSKDLLVHYIKKNHFDKKLSEAVSPRKRYKYHFRGEAEALKDLPMDDLKLIDQFIADIEPTGAKIPVLVKKYLSQNAKIVAFNVDPEFNHSLDGLVVVKLDEVPDTTFKMVEKSDITSKI